MPGFLQGFVTNNHRFTLVLVALHGHFILVLSKTNIIGDTK